MSAHALAIDLIAACTIAGVLVRPRGWPEAVWAVAGAFVLIATRLLSIADSWLAASKAVDVCLFLAGMMLLSELARREGVFDWCAAVAARHARGSPVRLFWLIYGVGVVVTVFLSNDATAVVMTPAVLAVARAARVRNPLPYLLACAFVANAASFTLPISNPANLVLFGGHLPRLGEWLRLFALPSAVATFATAGALFWLTRRDMVGEIAPPAQARLSHGGRFALCGIVVAATALMLASALGWPLGAPALGVAVLAMALAALGDPRVLWQVPRNVAWSVLPLVIGLFIVVEAVEKTGVLAACSHAVASLGTLPAWIAAPTAAFSVTLLSNIINNLPAGLLAGAALAHGGALPAVRDALLIGVDLGPNLSVTGSLATILWLIALRREGQHVSAWSFLKIGAVVMPCALIPAIIAVVVAHLR